jgi:hypothetical protein
MPFVLYNEYEGKTDQEEKFLTMIEKITDVIRTKIDKLEKKLKEGGKKRKIYTDNLSILKYKADKPDAPPVIYAKILTEKTTPPKITSIFYKKKTDKDVRNNAKIINGKLVKVDGEKYIRQKCEVIGGIKIENVFVGSTIESIQIKLLEAIVVKKIASQVSVLCEDLDLGSESESESEDDESVKKDPEDETDTDDE